jgi:hypothetical protein
MPIARNREKFQHTDESYRKLSREAKCCVGAMTIAYARHKTSRTAFENDSSGRHRTAIDGTNDHWPEKNRAKFE